MTQRLECRELINFGFRMRILVTGGSGFIGVNLVSAALDRSFTVANVDVQPPMDPTHRNLWIEGDVLSGADMGRVLVQFRPQVVVHLAARTDLGSDFSGKSYDVNDVGTETLLKQIRTIPGIERVVVASTMLVSRLGQMPTSDVEYSPQTEYGESKMRAELVTRSLDVDATWSIIRPTTVWGPWNIRLRDELLSRIAKGRYVHPSGRSAVRSYGYVGNVVHQILDLLDAPRELVHRKTYYVGDPAIDLLDYVNAFSLALTGKRVRHVPRSALAAGARFGDLLHSLGRPFPLSTYRLRNMTEDNVLDVDPIIGIAGRGPVNLEEGVRRTIEWAQV